MITPVWFVTGASSGLGRALAEVVLERGHRAILAARDTDTVADLLSEYGGRAHAVRLDVDHADQVTAAIDEGERAFGRLDVVVNNAGFALIGAFEDLAEAEVRAQLETNFFGAWRVTRAVLPGMRRRRSGTVVNVSSQGGFAAMEGTAAYSASKFALEGMSEALALEVAPFGIRVVIVEPGPFRTAMRGRNLRTPAARPAASPYPDHGASLRALDGRQDGDPRRAAQAIVAAVEADDPPLRLVLGATAVDVIRSKIARLSSDLDRWEAAGVATSYAHD